MALMGFTGKKQEPGWGTLGTVTAPQGDDTGGDFGFFRPGFTVGLAMGCLNGFFNANQAANYREESRTQGDFALSD
jgi:hypothetical protein